MNEHSSKNGLEPIQGDIQSILERVGCPLPHEMIQPATDESEQYVGTGDDFIRALAWSRAARHNATLRDRAEARAYADAAPATDPDSPVAKAASEFLAKMNEAVKRGIAEWTGTPKWPSEPGTWRLIPPKRQQAWNPDRVPRFNTRKFTVNDIRQSFRKVRQTSSDSWRACCPAHNDKNPSLTITYGRDRWLFKCWSHGCTWIAILNAAGLGHVDTRIGVNR